jgi:nucleolar complex protein 3
MNFTGEALDIDLDEFINQLYALVLPLSLMADIDIVPGPSQRQCTSNVSGSGQSNSNNDRGSSPKSKEITGDGSQSPSVGSMLFRALHLVFSPRMRHPAWRSAAFAKRLLTASLNWPAGLVMQTLTLVRALLGQEPKLEALLPSADSESGGAGGGGVYRPDVDDPQVCNAFSTSWWELYTLRDHWDANVREEAGKLCVYTRA